MDKRVEDAIHQRARRESASFMLKQLRKDLDVRMSMHETVLVAALNKKRKILDIGFNDPRDLILNNFGNWIAGIFRAPSTGNMDVTLTSVTPTARSVPIYKAQFSSLYAFNAYAQNQFAGALGMQMQVGSGVTPAARANTKIETAFGTAPESGRFGASNAGYGGGTMSISGSTGAGGAGTVNETGLFAVWNYGYGLSDTFMLFHDILGVGVAFVAGNTLLVSYSIVM